MKKIKKVIGIKCFDMDLTCRDFQFELGKTYEIEGELKMCYNGFHFHHHSQLKHVFSYYYPAEVRYCLVIGEDVIMDNDKSVARKITILKELSLSEVINIRTRKMIKHGISKSQDEIGGLAIQKGYRGIAGQTSDCGIAGQTGYHGSANQIGNSGLSGQIGDYGIASQTGYHGIAIQMGIDGLAIQDGEYGIAIALGKYGRAMVLNDKGAILIQNWIQDDTGDWQVKNGLYARVGDTLPNGEIMATNTWYWYEKGILKSMRK